MVSLFKTPLEKEAKHIEKWYYKHNQRLYVTCVEDWYAMKPKNRNNIEIILTDEKGKDWGMYLFDIFNYNMSTYLEVKPRIRINIFNYQKPCKEEDVFVYSYLSDYSHRPFYMNKEFYLKKSTPITKEDIYKCTKYYLRKVLKDYWIWNIQVVINKSKQEIKED